MKKLKINYKKQTSSKQNKRVIMSRKGSYNKFALYAGSLVFAFAGAAFVAFSLAATQVVKVADHPQAVLQSTATGKRLHTLKTWNGNIYAGYGDYGANTGPVAITPFNGTTFGTQQIAADTEAIYLFREIKGILYGVSADPKSSADVVIGTNNNGTVSWVNKRFVGTTHAYDIFTLTGDDLWIVGSQGVNAKAWRSLDGGATWQESLSLANVNTTRTDDFARFYGAIVKDGKIYVQAQDYYGSVHPTSKVFDGQTWTDGPYIGRFNSSNTFAGQSIYHTSFHVGSYASLAKFDGTKSIGVAPTAIYNYTIDGDTLYILSADGQGTVYMTKDLVNWTKIGPTTSVASSIAVLNGVIYVGGTDAGIYKVTVSDIDTTPPTVQLTTPTSGATVSGQVNISGTSTDNVGVARVEFIIDGSVIGTDTTAPYSYSWSTSSLPNGPKTVALRSYDTAGNSAITNAITVSVNNQADSEKPSVTINSPASGYVIDKKGIVRISASSIDNIGVVKSEIWINDKLQATSASGSITSNWNAKRVPSGPYTITVKAYDARNNEGTATVNINK